MHFYLFYVNFNNITNANVLSLNKKTIKVTLFTTTKNASTPEGLQILNFFPTIFDKCFYLSIQWQGGWGGGEDRRK